MQRYLIKWIFTTDFDFITVQVYIMIRCWALTSCHLLCFLSSIKIDVDRLNAAMNLDTKEFTIASERPYHKSKYLHNQTIIINFNIKNEGWCN